VRPSPHYYVLSLGNGTAMLFEAFRDSLIGIRNQGFPVHEPVPPAGLSVASLEALARRTDHCLAHYYGSEPLGLVVVGDAGSRSAFRSVTTHGDAVIGSIDGDHTDTTLRDLGQIVWPVVREALSDVLPEAMRDLAVSSRTGRLSSGLESVARHVGTGVRLTLLVEDDYHRKGSLGYPDRWPVISSEVDVRDAVDDVIDTVIEKVIETGGNVVFAPGGSLGDWERIVAVPREPVGT